MQLVNCKTSNFIYIYIYIHTNLIVAAQNLVAAIRVAE